MAQDGTKWREMARNGKMWHWPNWPLSVEGMGSTPARTRIFVTIAAFDVGEQL
jgi:hypothetical protein